MNKSRIRKAIQIASIGVLVLSIVTLAGCVRISNGTWYVRSAPVPEGWPELTPVGEVEVKDYPVYRAASISAADIKGDGMKPLFLELFRHIKDNDIAMTAPVEIGYDVRTSEPEMTSMAFFYRRRDQGRVGNEGAVRIDDRESRTYASVGVRGYYNTRNYSKGLALLEDWLGRNPQWQAEGPVRYLGYNSPFVPSFARYGEVQIEVVCAADVSSALALGVVAAEPNRSPARRTNSIGMELTRIPAGEFAMGSPRDEKGRDANEGPMHQIRITNSFYLGVHEVTVGQFRTFVEATGYLTEAERDVDGGFGVDFTTGRVVQDADCTWREPGFPDFEQTDDHPVVLISWQDAEAFCEWLSQREGTVYRLPTEAEWEYACRGGTATAYWTGVDAASLSGSANVADEALAGRMPLTDMPSAFDDGFPFTAPIGSFAANPFGLHDMHGNVWEWCQDWYGQRAYEQTRVDDPTGPVTGTFRAIRGGGWLNGPLRNRSAQRIYFVPSFRYCLLSGFRVVLDPDCVASLPYAPKGPGGTTWDRLGRSRETSGLTASSRAASRHCSQVPEAKAF